MGYEFILNMTDPENREKNDRRIKDIQSKSPTIISRDEAAKILFDRKSRKDESKVIEEESDIVKTEINGEEFIFDKEGYNLFQTQFWDKEKYFLVVRGKSEKSKGYLARKNKLTNKLTSFHTWIKSEDAVEFAEANSLGRSGVEIHHLDHNTHNNCQDNLEPREKRRHREIHQIERERTKRLL